jgi:hypothetical protein
MYSCLEELKKTVKTPQDILTAAPTRVTLKIRRSDNHAAAMRQQLSLLDC